MNEVEEVTIVNKSDTPQSGLHQSGDSNIDNVQMYTDDDYRVLFATNLVSVIVAASSLLHVITTSNTEYAAFAGIIAPMLIVFVSGISFLHKEHSLKRTQRNVLYSALSKELANSEDPNPWTAVNELTEDYVEDDLIKPSQLKKENIQIQNK
jgi:hypothetical protein